MSAKSIANVQLGIGEFSFGVKVCELVDPVKLNTRELCADHGRPVDYDQRCPECRHRVKESVIGTPAPMPIKQRFCTNQKCGVEVTGKVISKPYCDDCEATVKDGKLEDGYLYGKGLVRITPDEAKALKELRLGKGIHVFSAAPVQQLLTLMRYVRSVYQLLPDKNGNDALAFELFRTAAKGQSKIFLAQVVLKQEAKHLKFEYDNGGIVHVDPDGLMMLTLLNGMHEVQPEIVPAADVDGRLLNSMGALQRIIERPFSPAVTPEMAATAGTRALHALLQHKKEGQPYRVPAPQPLQHEMAELAAALSRQLKESMPARRSRTRQGARA